MKSIGSLLFCLVILASCTEHKVQELDQTPNWTQDESINMNATFAEEEDQEIENFLTHRPDWKMTKTGTGLRYFVYSIESDID